MASAPRKIFKLPTICAMTKPTSTMPVTAITTFLPTMVFHNATAGLLGHTLRDFLTGSDLRRSATVPSSNRVAMCRLQPLSSSFRGTGVPQGAGNGEFQQQSTSARNVRPPDTLKTRQATVGLSFGACHPRRDVCPDPPRWTGHEHGLGSRGARL